MTNIKEKVADCLVRAGSTFREDQKEAYRRAIADESNSQSCWVMQQVLDNAIVAEERRSPLCDDTGIPHLFLEVGKNRSVTAVTRIVSLLFWRFFLAARAIRPSRSYFAYRIEGFPYKSGLLHLF